MGHVIGIDLGTTYSAVAVFDERKGAFTIIPSRKGTPTTPSVVAFKDGEILVGENAKARLALDKENTVAEVKREMGRKDGDTPWTVAFGGRQRSPEEISSYILKELKERAEEYLGEPVTAAVITVPAYFTEPPRTATIEAGRLAGLEVKKLVNEPTAAAIAFGASGAQAEVGDEDEAPRSRKVLVYDLGGGTFDVSVIQIHGRDVEVLATGGDHRLGGVDFDNAIIGWVLERIQADHGVDLRPEAMDGLDPKTAAGYRKAYARIYDLAEKTKITLSAQARETISLPYLFMGDGEMVSIEYELSRNEFLMRIAELLKGTLRTVDETLESGKLAKTDIDDVLLVGGSTRIPKVRDLVERHFGKAPRTDINPDECVALGAAMEALPYRDLSGCGEAEKVKIEEQLDKMGTVLDITGFSLGVGAYPDKMVVLIPRNSKIPTSAKEIFFTVEDMATMVQVNVFQGEDETASNNEMIGQFVVPDLPPLPKGQVKIEIRFELDMNGVLTVTATNLLTRKTCGIETRGVKHHEVKADELPPPDSRPGPAPQARPAGDEVPERVRSLWVTATKKLPGLSEAERTKLEAVMMACREAWTRGEPSASQKAESTFEDALFDLM